MTAALTAGHALAFLCAAAAGGRSFALAWLFALAASLVVVLRREALRSARGVTRRLALAGDLRCLAWRVGGTEPAPARVEPRIVQRGLVMLRLVFDAGGTDYVTVCADAVDDGTFRRLLARLRLSAPAA